jgi:hypothetical protein
MLINLLGWFWFILGVISLIRPQILKNILQKKSIKKIKKVLIAIGIFLGLWLISAGFNIQGFLSKFLMILGIIVLVKALLFLKLKTADRIIEWFSRKPLSFYRLAACIYMLIGIIIILN